MTITPNSDLKYDKDDKLRTTWKFRGIKYKDACIGSVYGGIFRISNP